MRNSVCTLVFAAAAIALSGCGEKAEDVSFKTIRGDLTPELSGLAERPDDVSRNIATTNNQNSRMFSDDLGRMFYTDHPSRLSPLPIMYTSGSPR